MTRAVVLAGGLGSRLHPYTVTFPKALLPVGGRPILELLLCSLRTCGVTRVTILTGHLAYLLEGYFGDGSDLSLPIDYVHDARPQGTAGPLRAIRGQVTSTFLVVNGDVITDLDMRRLLSRHEQTGADLTVATYQQVDHLTIGVVHTDSDDVVTDYREKPTVARDVSMGLYALSPPALDVLPDGPVDMPDMIKILLAAGRTVVAYRHSGIWLDIGRPEDNAAAQKLADSSAGVGQLDPDSPTPIPR